KEANPGQEQDKRRSPKLFHDRMPDPPHKTQYHTDYTPDQKSPGYLGSVDSVFDDFTGEQPRQGGRRKPQSGSQPTVSGTVIPSAHNQTVKIDGKAPVRQGLTTAQTRDIGHGQYEGIQYQTYCKQYIPPFPGYVNESQG